MTASHFITHFDATLLDEVTRQGRRLWRLDSPLIYFSAGLNRQITVPTGFVTDLESCPRWPVIFWLVGDIVYESACLHDYIYAVALFPRPVCDKLLEESSMAAHVPTREWQAFVLWAGVRIGGASHYGTHITTS